MNTDQTSSPSSDHLIDTEAVYTARKYVTKESTAYFVRLDEDKYALLVPYIDNNRPAIANMSWLFAWTVGCRKGSNDGQLFVRIKRDEIPKNLQRFCFQVFGEHYTISLEIT